MVSWGIALSWIRKLPALSVMVPVRAFFQVTLANEIFSLVNGLVTVPWTHRCCPCRQALIRQQERHVASCRRRRRWLRFGIWGCFYKLTHSIYEIPFPEKTRLPG